MFLCSILQSHAFHLAFTTVIGLAAYQAVIALARNSEDFDTWDGVLMTGANVALLFPILAIPIIFGGLRSRRLRDLSPTSEVNPQTHPSPDRISIVLGMHSQCEWVLGRNMEQAASMQNQVPMGMCFPL
jgi:hypothetical protein